MAVLLVYIGFRIYGAIIGFLSGIILASIVLFYNIKSMGKTKVERFDIRIFSEDNFYFVCAMIIIVLIYSLDVIFAKIFFSAEIAGRYSVISLIGKMILFVVSSVGTAMFPINTERFVKGGSTNSVFRKAIILSLIVCFGALTFFFIFPHFIINLLFGSDYASLSNLLIYLGIAFSFCSLLYILILHNISINKIKILHILGLALFLAIEVLFFTLFHSTIEQFAIGFMISNIIAFLGGYFILRK